MATEEKPVHEQVQDLLESWNPAPTEGGLAYLIGDQADRRDPVMDHDRNFGRSDIDAERMGAYDDDADDDESDDGLDDMNIKELRKEVDKRNEGLDEEDHLSKGGSADEIRERLRAFDNGDSEDDDSEDDDDE